MFNKVLETLAYVKERSPFYRNILNIDVKTEEDFRKIPFTSKEQLQAQNEDFFCVSWDEIIDVTTTSGTTGEPVICPLTENDLQRLAENEFRALGNAGITHKDRVVLTTTLDKRFMAGLAYFSGLRKIGAAVVRTGPGAPSFQWNSIIKLKATAIIVVPSFLIKLIEFAIQNKIDYKSSLLKKAICIGEPIRKKDLTLNSLGQKLHELWPDLAIFSTYASTEMATAFTEDFTFRGGIPLEDMIYCEIIDNEGNVIPNGEEGELVITNIGIEAMPLIRYKTGDILKKISTEEGSYRLSPLIGRKNYMMKIKGTTLFPEQVFEALHSIDGVNNYILQIEHDQYGMDLLKVIVSRSANSSNVKSHLKSLLRVTPEVLTDSDENILSKQFPAGARKPIKIIDLRIKD